MENYCDSSINCCDKKSVCLCGSTEILADFKNNDTSGLVKILNLGPEIVILSGDNIKFSSIEKDIVIRPNITMFITFKNAHNLTLFSERAKVCVELDTISFVSCNMPNITTPAPIPSLSCSLEPLTVNMINDWIISTSTIEQRIIFDIEEENY